MNSCYKQLSANELKGALRNLLTISVKLIWNPNTASELNDEYTPYDNYEWS